MIYDEYKYLYPPRPELKITPDSISTYDNRRFLAQPKLNGSCCELFVKRNDVIQKGRHNNTLTRFNIENNEMLRVFGSNKWNVIVGEYMNKSKRDEHGSLFNDKFVIFDQLVFDGEYVLGTTYKYRVDVMSEMYEPIDETDYLYKISDNIYMVKSFYTDFRILWNNIVKTDMYEGLVMKSLNGKLVPGYREKNNNMTQVKVRKSTKNYEY